MSAVLANTNITLDNTSAITIPSTPSAGQTVIYPKADKLLYYKDDAGVEQRVVTPLTPATGSVIQVISVTKTNTFSTTSGSMVDITGLSAAITPSSSSSKILITGSVCWGNSDTVPFLVAMQLVRNSTAICVADAAGSRGRFTIGAQGIYNTDNTVFAPLNFLDSPATTSATTYKMQGQAESGRTLWINRGGESDGDSPISGRFVSTITLMEIAG